jgi:hypothetical protein
MDIFNTYATDEVAEVEGRWQKIGKDAKVLVARTGNARYQKEFRKALERHEGDLGTGSEEADKLAEEILIEVMAKTILLGWEGLSYQGQTVEYSVDMAKTLLRVKDFRKRVMAIADNLENFKIQAEVAQGNA